MSFREILEFPFLTLGDYQLTLWNVVAVFLIFLIIRIVSRLLRKLINRYFKNREIEEGRVFAVNQFIRYFLFTLAVLISLQSLGIKLAAIWAGSAALLVGIGFGLQQTFNDIFSGLIILFEGTVSVGDIIKVDNIVSRVEKIGLRTSKVISRDNVAIIIPNHKLILENAINWSHETKSTRFQIHVGVAYGSDVKKVTELLLQVADEHPSALEIPIPRVEFKDFGNSSLDFALHFFSREYLRVEFIKSEMRYRVDELFRENNITIPFPQRDLWIKNPETLTEHDTHS